MRVQKVEFSGVCRARSVAIVVSAVPRRLLYGASLRVIFHGDRTP